MGDTAAQKLDRIRGALMEAGYPSGMVDNFTTLNAEGKGRYSTLIFTRKETWQAAEVARAGRPRCWRCWSESFARPPGSERDTFRRGCLAASWLMADCYRPDRR